MYSTFKCECLTTKEQLRTQQTRHYHLKIKPSKVQEEITDHLPDHLITNTSTMLKMEMFTITLTLLVSGVSITHLKEECWLGDIQLRFHELKLTAD